MCRTDELQRSAGGGRGRGVAVRHAAADAGGGGVAGVGGQPGQVGGAARVSCCYILLSLQRKPGPPAGGGCHCRAV